MQYLLDTHILIWLESEPEKVPTHILNLLTNKSVIAYYSMASLWEISIKNSLKRNDFSIDIDKLLASFARNNFFELTIKSEHVKLIETLPQIHNDPFDRMLIAQAMSENLCLITDDGKIKQYQDVNLLD